MADGVSSRVTAETMSGARSSRTARGRSPLGGRNMAEHWHKLFARVRTGAHVVCKQFVVPFGSGFLLGRAVVFGLLHPFGTAYVVALAAVGHRGRALIAACGVLLAAVTMTPGADAGEPTPVLMLVWLVAAFVGRFLDFSPWVSALGAMLGAATLRIVAAAFGGDSVVVAVVTGAVDLSAALALLPVAEQLFGQRGRRRRTRDDVPGTHSTYIDSAYAASLLLFVSLLLLGTQGMQLLGYSLHALLTRGMLLLAAVSGGVGAGAAVGTVLGLLALLGTGGVIWESVLFAGAGMAAGIGGAYGRPGALLGMLIAHLLLAPYAPTGDVIGSAIVHCLLAAGAVAFVPRALLRRWQARLGTVMAGAAGRQQGQAAAEAVRERLRRFADVFEQAAAGIAGDDRPTVTVGLGATDVEAGGELAGAHWEIGADVDFGVHWGGRSKADAGLGTANDGRFSAVAVNEEAVFDSFVQDVFQTVCRGCSHQSVCWDTYAYQTYRDLLTLAADAAPSADGQQPPSFDPRDLPAGLRQRCIKPQHFAPGVEKLLIMMRDKVRRHEQMHTVQAPMQRQLSGIADIIAGVAQELNRVEADSRGRRPAQRSEKPRFRLQMDHVYVPGDASLVSGDCFQRVDLPDSRVAFIVCDGMGSGTRAAVESQAVVAMLRRFLEAGFDLHFCVHTINAVMLLRATEESFVTVDVSVVDLRDGTVHMLKTGAAPTFIHRGYEVEMVRADSLPVGILRKVEVYEYESKLDLGDVLVMMSDGGLDLGTARGDKAEAVRRKMQRLERPRPKQVVDSLFAGAHHSTGQRVPDDVTIIAAQLLPAVIELL